MKLYQYPNCSTCRKAIKFLRDNDIAFISIDITQQPPTRAELRNMLAGYDGNIRKLFNTSGMQYRELNLKDRLADMTNTEAIDLLAGNGKLIKRPFLVTGNSGVVGFSEASWQAMI